MYTMAASIDVDPLGCVVELTLDQVWRGLVMKAENALPFVPAMQECVVLERFANGLTRTVLARGERFIERVTFTPRVAVLFQRTDAIKASYVQAIDATLRTMRALATDGVLIGGTRG